MVNKNEPLLTFNITFWLRFNLKERVREMFQVTPLSNLEIVLSEQGLCMSSPSLIAPQFMPPHDFWIEIVSEPSSNNP